MSKKGLYPSLPGGLLNVTTALASDVSLSDCQVETADLQDSAVTTVKINNGAVTAAKLSDTYIIDGDSRVLTSHLKDSGVTTAKLADSNITTIKLDGLSVTTAKIADSNVTTAKLIDSAVTSAKLADSAVLTAKITNSQVTYAKIQAVTAARLLGRYDAVAGVVQEITLAGGLTFDSTAGTISSDTTIAVTLSDSQVDSSVLADNAVSSAGIQDSAVLTAKIADSQITYAKIQAVTAQRLLGRWDAANGITQEVPLSAELRFDSANDWLEISDCGILVNLIKDSAVSTVKLLDSAVTAVKIDATAVTTAKINDVAVTAAKLADTSVITAKINDLAVTAAKLYDTNILRRVVDLHITDTVLTVGDTFATFFIPAELDSFDLVRAEMCAKISSTTGNPTIQIRDVTGAADMLSTKITLDTGEKTSYTAAAASVVDTGNDTVLTGTEIAIDIDSAGTAEDVHILLSFRKP